MGNEPALLYDDRGVRLWHADTLDVLEDVTPLDIGRPRVLLADPPYAAWAHVRALEDTGQFDFERDAEWQVSVFGWAMRWMVPLRRRMAEDARALVFCHQHYVGFYLRLARLLAWPWRAVWGCQPDEVLVYLSYDKLSPDEARLMAEAVRLNTYGQDKRVDMLRMMLQAVAQFDEALVVDPFCGGGSTLCAAQSLGLPAVGLEVMQPVAARAAARLRGEEPWP
jgi:hypothetical protein